MMRLWRLLSNGEHQFLWRDGNGVPKTHHKRDCPHCRARGYEVGCTLPFRQHQLVEKDTPVFSFWRVRNSWRKLVKANP